jgi:hypothetical protein
MNAQIGHWIAQKGIKAGRGWGRTAKSICLALLLGAAALTMNGCAGYYEPGFGSSYYSPDYGSYYGDYGYNYAPWDYGAYGGDILIGGIHHHGYYGGHHFGHDFHGSGGGFHGGGFHGGGGHGGGGHR